MRIYWLSYVLLLSLVLWIAVVACGRGIAYVLPPP